MSVPAADSDRSAYPVVFLRRNDDLYGIWLRMTEGWGEEGSKGREEGVEEAGGGGRRRWRRRRRSSRRTSCRRRWRDDDVWLGRLFSRYLERDTERENALSW